MIKSAGEYEFCTRMIRNAALQLAAMSGYPAHISFGLGLGHDATLFIYLTNSATAPEEKEIWLIDRDGKAKTCLLFHEFTPKEKRRCN